MLAAGAKFSPAGVEKEFSEDARAARAAGCPISPAKSGASVFFRIWARRFSP